MNGQFNKRFQRGDYDPFNVVLIRAYRVDLQRKKRAQKQGKK